MWKLLKVSSIAFFFYLIHTYIIAKTIIYKVFFKYIISKLKRAMKKILITIICTFSFFSFLGAQEIKVETLVQSTKSWNGKTLPLYKKGQPEIAVLKLTVPPKAIVPWHTHPVMIAAYILQGEITVKTDKNEKNVLKKGDAIVEVVETLHHAVNEGKEDTIIIVFYAGIKNVPNSVLKEKNKK